MSQMFQQALWIAGKDQEDESQKVDLLKAMTGAGLERNSAPDHFKKAVVDLDMSTLRKLMRLPRGV
jgi:hypothetical protein